jgi:hypothetical protein
MTIRDLTPAEREADNDAAVAFSGTILDYALRNGLWHGPRSADVFPRVLTSLLASYIASNMRQTGHKECIDLIDRELREMVPEIHTILERVEEEGPQAAPDHAIVRRVRTAHLN